MARQARHVNAYFREQRNPGRRSHWRETRSMFLLSQGPIQHTKRNQNLSFTNVKHVVTTLDAQPSVNNGIVVLVTGQLQVQEIFNTVAIPCSPCPDRGRGKADELYTGLSIVARG